MNIIIVLLGLALPAQDAPPLEDANTLSCEQREHALRLRAENIESRGIQIAARDADVAKREKALEAYKAPFGAQIDALSKRVAEMERKLGVGDGARQAHEERMVVLAETLTNLSAKKAAPLLASMDPAVVGDLLIRLGASRSAALLALMPPNSAARFLEQVSKGPSNPAAPEVKK
jgi:flagellar motility protein MotE (MotC chaperone)